MTVHLRVMANMGGQVVTALFNENGNVVSAFRSDHASPVTTIAERWEELYDVTALVTMYPTNVEFKALQAYFTNNLYKRVRTALE